MVGARRPKRGSAPFWTSVVVPSRQGQGGPARVVLQGFPYCSVREGVYAAEVAVVQVFYLVIGDPAFGAGGGNLVSFFGFSPVGGSAAA